MTRALFRKELRELLPWGFLMGALALSEIAVLFIEQIDMLPLGRTFWSLNDAETLFYWFAAFAIGTGLAIREHDDGTLGFLDGLPVSRSRVFLVKCAVMLALVLVAPAMRVAALLVLHAISRESLGGEWHPTLIAEAAALQVLLIGNGLFVGAALGRLRSLTWFALGAAAAVLLAVVDRIPRAASFNPFSLLAWQSSEAGLRVDSNAILTQMIVAAVAMLIAWRGFVGAGRARRARLTERPLAGAAVTLATLGAAFAVLVLAVPRLLGPSVLGRAASGGSASYVFAESPPAEIVTSHYRFSYPAHESEAALALSAEADAIFERVHALLGVPLGESIDVDASGSARNTHGTAFFGRIRMVLSSDARMVLAHETAHVVAQRVAGGATGVAWAAADVLSEGLASWVDAYFREPSWSRDDRMLTLAALHTRRELIVDELAAPGALAIVRDEGLKYSAGEALIRAAVRLYGEPALSRLLEAFADPRLPSDVAGLALWQGAFQLAGMDLPAVIDELYREIAAYAAAHEARIAALPRPRTVLVTQGGAYGILTVVDDVPRNDDVTRRTDLARRDDVTRVDDLARSDDGFVNGDADGLLRSDDDAGAAPPELVLRLRPTPDSPLATISSVDTAPGRLYWLSPHQVASGRACVQPGVRLGDERLLEPWTCTPLRDAVDLRAVREPD